MTWTRVEGDSGTIVDSGTWLGTRDGDERAGEEAVIVQSISADTASPTTIQPITLDQNSGDISITVAEPAKEDQ